MAEDDRRFESEAEHEAAQRLRFARLTLTEKLEWLEQAHRFVLSMQEAREKLKQERREAP